MNDTAIGWTDHTLNFWWGCTKVSPACTNCYAEKFAAYAGRRIFGHPVEWGPGKQRGERLERARKEALALDRKAVKAGHRYRVFVNSMSDWLDVEVPIEWLEFLLETIFLCPNLDFQLLTKRPENFWSKLESAMESFQDSQMNTTFWRWLCLWGNHRAPNNVWIGTTVEDQTRADERIPHLLKIPAQVRFLSCEPLLGPVELPVQWEEPEDGGKPYLDGIHWVIAGGESGAKNVRLSHPNWFRSLRDQCVGINVPFFFKQWGDWMPLAQAPESAQQPKMKGLWITPEGDGFKTENARTDGLMVRIGAANAGNLLDGRLWEQFPGEEPVVSPCSQCRGPMEPERAHAGHFICTPCVDAAIDHLRDHHPDDLEKLLADNSVPPATKPL